VNTIFIRNEKVEIDMEGCIRCGKCHNVCQEDAVRHDSEKIPDEVRINVAKTKEFIDACEKYLGDKSERQKCLNRMMKHFKSKKVIAEKTLDKLESLN